MAEQPDDFDLELSEYRYTKALWTRRIYALKPNSAPRRDLAELLDTLDNLPDDERKLWFDDHGDQLNLILRPDADSERSTASES